MRAAALIVLALASSPVEAKPAQCVLWPYSPSCQIEVAPVPVPVPDPPPAAPVQSAPAPAPLPAPVFVPPPVAAPLPAPAPVRPVKAAPPPKRLTFAKPKRKPALPWWCARVPAGTPLWMVKSAAIRELKRSLTDAEIKQAQACLASKR